MFMAVPVLALLKRLGTDGQCDPSYDTLAIATGVSSEARDSNHARPRPVAVADPTCPGRVADRADQTSGAESPTGAVDGLKKKMLMKGVGFRQSCVQAGAKARRDLTEPRVMRSRPSNPDIATNRRRLH
jgi:hypothetical protein